MLPFDARDLNNKSSNSGKFMDVKFPEYIRRLCDTQQMDFENTFDQILTLLSLEPQNIYTSFYYRKQTKNQWARDDPAFVVIVTMFVAVSSLAYAIAFKHPNLWSYLWSVLYSVVVDWLLVGFAIASTYSHLANKYLRQYHSHSVEQEVEWLYAFDVHANAYLCSFMITFVVQYFLLPLLLERSILSCVVSNTLYASSFIWYSYITYLGYRGLPFLGNTQAFLWYPTVVVSMGWLFSIILLLLGLKLNMTRIIMAFHYG